MRKYILLIAALLIYPNVIWAACSGSSPTWTCTYDTAIADIQTCVTGATIGDTINITAGTATWSTALTVTKGLKIVGAGIDTTIINNSNSSANDIIRYIPSNTAADDLFEVTGFTFNQNIASTSSAGRGVYMYHTSTNRMKNIRIHGNKFVNTTASSATYAIYSEGLIYPVIDSNSFYLTNPTTANTGFKFLGNSQNAWNNYIPSYSGEDLPYRVYLEDNYFANRATIISSGHGSRYVARYNTIAFTTTATKSPVFDAHGNQDSGIYSSQVVEVYGNKLYHISGSTINSSLFFGQRGGLGLCFYNQLTNFGSSSNSGLSEETADSVSPVTLEGQVPQHISDTYHWSNRLGTGTLISRELVDVDGSIAENSEYFLNNGTAAFDGTKQTGAGVGCGTLANRPGTCTTGVGYWATDQSCTSMTGMVGQDPDTPISGTLYKCTATNTWTAYYTPYTYPHPLRTDAPADVTAPTATWEIDSTGLIATGTFSETVDAVTKTGVSFTGSVTGAITATYKDGMPGGIVRYDLNKEVQQGETMVVDYTTPGTGIKDLAGNALADISDGSVSNGSTQSTPPLVTLTIGTHTGSTVNVYPGISCGSTCGPVEYDNGTVLTLNITTLPNYTGCTIGGTGCGASTTMSEARNCTVTCTKIAPDYTLGSGATVTIGSGAAATIQ